MPKKNSTPTTLKIQYDELSKQIDELNQERDKVVQLMTGQKETLTSLKKEYDNLAKKIDEWWQEREKVVENSKIDLLIKREISALELEKRILTDKIKEKGNKDPYYF